MSRRLEVREALLLIDTLEDLVEQHQRNGLSFPEFDKLIDALLTARNDIIRHNSSAGFYVPEQAWEH